MSYERLEHAGAAVTTALTSAITSGDTTLTLDDVTGWPTGGVGPFYLEIDAGTAVAEKVLATSRSGNIVSGLTRGADDTTAFAHDTGASVIHGFTATEADEANWAVSQLFGQAAVRGEIPMTSSVGQYTMLPKGTTGYPIVAGTAFPTYNQLGAAGIADGAVGAAALSAFLHVDDFSATAGSGVTSGQIKFPHGASFTPTRVFVSIESDTIGTLGERVWVTHVVAIDATNVTVAMFYGGNASYAGAVTDGTVVTGSVLVFA